MDIVIIFESSDNKKLIEALSPKNYYKGWIHTVDGVKNSYNLPENTLWKQNLSLEDAIQEVEKTAKEKEIILLKCFSFPVAPWSGMKQK